MGLYNKYILPALINKACSQNPASKQREKVVPQAKGKVLEIGIGSGLNLPFYNPDKIEKLIGIDPSQELWNKTATPPEEIPFQFEFRKAYAEDIPADNSSFDQVLFTYTMCSIPDTSKAFEEIRRVLKPGGELLFCEHGKAPDKYVARWQALINPIWKKVSGGCNLNRDIKSLIEQNGFKIDHLNTMYIPGWKPASFNFWGAATSR